MKQALTHAYDRTRELVFVHLGHAILRLLRASLCVEYRGYEGQQYWVEGSSRILAFWHGHQLFMPWCYLGFYRTSNKRDIYVLASRHRDGSLIRGILGCMGVRSVAGSSSRGGVGSTKQLLACLRAGDHVAITPDGPKGPIHTVKPGVIKLAQLSGIAIYPMAIHADKCWRLKSWDRMIIPKPFSRVVITMGKPLTVERRLSDTGVDEQCELLEKMLNGLNENF